MIGIVPKVHLVFENQHLLQRDRIDFESYWLLLGYDSTQVDYHVGLDFAVQPGELVIVDAADSLIFRDSVHFQ